MCSGESLWSSKEEIYEHILNKEIEYLPNHKLNKFIEKDEKVECELLYDNELKTLSFILFSLDAMTQLMQISPLTLTDVLIMSRSLSTPSKSVIPSSGIPI